MPEDTPSIVKRLLRPACDPARWHAEVERLDTGEACAVLLDLVRHEAEPHLRTQAVSLLGHLRCAGATEVLLDLVGSREPLLRARSALALGQVGADGEPACEALLRALDDEDEFVRRSAARALGLLKRADAVPRLEAMREEAATTRKAVDWALAAIRGEIDPDEEVT